MKPDQALKELRKRAGTNSALAKWAKCSRQAVSNWKKVPAERVIDIERASGMSRHEIRVDIFGAAR